MKKSSVVVLTTVAAGALATSGAMPASAAVNYKTTTASTIGEFPAIDTSTNTIYSYIDTFAANGTETTSLSAVNGSTLKTKATVVLATGATGFPVNEYLTDLRVNAKTHTVWLALGGDYGGGTVEAFNGSTLKETAIFGLGSAPDELAVNPTTNTAYVASGAGDDDPTGTEPTLYALNGTNGSQKSVELPLNPAYDLYGAGNVAFDSSNNGIYVAFDGLEYAYASSTLKLASSVAFPSTENTTPSLTADGSTHVIYAVGNVTLYKIAGSTNTISSTASIGSTGGDFPVVDTTIKTLYVGTKVFSETTLAQGGTISHTASSVNGSTHTIYSPGYVITRSGS